jgi:hypothetical protein
LYEIDQLKAASQSSGVAGRVISCGAGRAKKKIARKDRKKTQRERKKKE